MIKPQCTKCKGSESPHSVENVSVGHGTDLWVCHECGTVIKKMGRPSQGVTRKVSITLPESEWEFIEKLVSLDHGPASISEYFRLVHRHARYDSVDTWAEDSVEPMEQMDIYTAIKKAQEMDVVLRESDK